MDRLTSEQLPFVEKKLHEGLVILRTTLPPDFSSCRLIARMHGLKAKIPESEDRNRFFSAVPTDPRRQASWFLSRLCLVDALERLLRLNTAPDQRTISYGLSHTDRGAEKTAAVAVASYGRAGARIGIDLEFSHRPVSDRVFFRVTDEEERRLGVSPLEFWVMKEAAFKAANGVAAFVSDFRITECTRIEAALGGELILRHNANARGNKRGNKFQNVEWSGRFFYTGLFLVGIVTKRE